MKVGVFGSLDFQGINGLRSNEVSAKAKLGLLLLFIGITSENYHLQETRPSFRIRIIDGRTCTDYT
jgi:hypothetical protein